MRLCIVTSSIVSFIALIIFLVRNAVHTSYAGASLIYAFQVCMVMSAGFVTSIKRQEDAGERKEYVCDFQCVTYIRSSTVFEI